MINSTTLTQTTNVERLNLSTYTSYSSSKTPAFDHSTKINNVLYWALKRLIVPELLLVAVLKQLQARAFTLSKLY